MKETLVINLIGGPGSGKSTCASGIFYKLKQLGVNCELSLEFAKDKVWEGSVNVLDDQFYVFGKQYHRLFRLNGKVDVIITDSPLLVSILYNKTKSDYFDKLVVEQYNSFNNLMFFINRPDDYQTEGRLQTRMAAKTIDIMTKDMLEKYNIKYKEISCDDAVDKIVDIIIKQLNKK